MCSVYWCILMSKLSRTRRLGNPRANLIRIYSCAHEPTSWQNQMKLKWWRCNNSIFSQKCRKYHSKHDRTCLKNNTMHYSLTIYLFKWIYEIWARRNGPWFTVQACASVVDSRNGRESMGSLQVKFGSFRFAWYNLTTWLWRIGIPCSLNECNARLVSIP